jgi:hypothetical protein
MHSNPSLNHSFSGLYLQLVLMVIHSLPLDTPQLASDRTGIR